MTLSPIDWAIVAGYFLLSTTIGLYFTKKGGESLDEYFLSGRQVPWWLAGAAMVATTFATDTPLVVTGLVATKGVAGNWLWWNFVMSGMLTTKFHQSQLPATPFVATRPVTTSGVSAANVVATIAAPASHHGT